MKFKMPFKALLKKLLQSIFVIAIALGFSTTGYAQDSEFSIRSQDFKSLFNSHRTGQPKQTPWAGNFWPYAGHGTSVLVKNGKEDPKGTSPMNALDFLNGSRRDEAHNWEREEHSCDKMAGSERESCEGWWGHCNGWAAAAIKEVEPRSSISVKGKDFSVADQKGILSEMWMSSNSLFTGDTDKANKIGKWVTKPGSAGYDAFWDVSPRTLFLIFTNYVGAMKNGIVLDRFTGDEVWNQPVVGYRILPIRKDDIELIEDGGKSYYSVFIRMKIYWANDMEKKPGNISKIFDIDQTTDSENIEEDHDESNPARDYEGRLVAYKLSFDREVTTSEGGKKIATAGKLVGDGIWDHQERVAEYRNLEDLNHTHPDFLWAPTNAYKDSSGYSNPFLKPELVAKLRNPDSIKPGDDEDKQELKYVVNIKATDFRKDPSEFTEKYIQGALKRVLQREGIKSVISLSDVKINAASVTVTMMFPNGEDKDKIADIFTSAGYESFKIK